MIAPGRGHVFAAATWRPILAERCQACNPNKNDMLQVEIASRCEAGERSHNEDSLRHGRTGSHWYAVLSDGAGGHRGGAEASDIVVRTTTLGFQSATEASPEHLTRLLCDVHDTVVLNQNGHHHDRMHATVVALWIDVRRAQAIWSHVGDSRLYLLRRGRVIHVTQDDSVVQRLVMAGHITPEEAQSHPSRNQLVSAMGAGNGVHPRTMTQPFAMEDGDAFLLCSDGWWEHFDATAIEAAAATAGNADEWLALMAGRIREAADPRQDNYSAVALRISRPAPAP